MPSPTPGVFPIEVSNPHHLHLPHWQEGASHTAVIHRHELTAGQWQATHFPKGRALLRKHFSRLLKQITLYKSLTIQGKYFQFQLFKRFLKEDAHYLTTSGVISQTSQKYGLCSRVSALRQFTFTYMHTLIYMSVYIDTYISIYTYTYLYCVYILYI